MSTADLLAPRPAHRRCRLTAFGFVLAALAPLDAAATLDLRELHASDTARIQAANTPPHADAGPRRILVQPESSVLLDGRNSHDLEDPPSSLVWAWSQLAGPTSATLAAPATATPTAANIAPGRYLFRLAVTDSGGLTATADVEVIVFLAAHPAGSLAGEAKTWHRLRLSLPGPATSETATSNPFRDLRLNVVFRSGDTTLVVPGHFAADGSAGTTHAASGSVWRADFMPPEAGLWTYYASFRAGPDIAASEDLLGGTAVALFDAADGSFAVVASDRSGRDLRAHGLLAYVGAHQYRFTASGRWYLKAGPNSPENLLAFSGFDGTVNTSHAFAPHLGDWQPGDPDWLDEEGHSGRALIGALNYLATKGMTSVSFLTMNVQGDGNDVWPWIDPTSRDRYDCSKLDQWATLVDHLTERGLVAHVVTQETENDQLLDGGALGPTRRIYYRELIARLAAVPGLVWNLGEETTNTPAEREAFASYIRATDPYDHSIVVHTYPGQGPAVYGPLLGFDAFEGPSLQIGDPATTHADVSYWVSASAGAGRPWVCTVDETGPALLGVMPDSVDPHHDWVRRDALYASLLAGGAGCEWYFGYFFPHHDLDCEDWRTRDRMWDQTRIALDAFETLLPFWRMAPADSLVLAGTAHCLAAQGDVYAVYLPAGGTATLDLGVNPDRFELLWVDPRFGGRPVPGAPSIVRGPGAVALGPPPLRPTDDALAVLRRLDTFVQSFGQGTPGFAGAIPSLDVLASPILGEASFGLVVEGARPGADVVLVLGLSTLAPPLPAAAGFIHVLLPDPAPPWFRIVPADANGQANFPTPLPPFPALQGLVAYAQAGVLDAAANSGLALTHALRFELH